MKPGMCNDYLRGWRWQW